MQIIISSKTRPTSLEEHTAFTIIIYFQFIQWPIAGDFLEGSFMELVAIHEFSKFQRKALMFATLGASETQRNRTYF
jgi:hypothetical protein